MDRPTVPPGGLPRSRPVAAAVGAPISREVEASLVDEAAAEAARDRLRDEGIVAIEPDERVGVALRPGEHLVAVRRAVSVERRAGWHHAEDGLQGDLYVTTQRLLHLGRIAVECPVEDIREAVVADGALLLVVGDYRGITIRVPDPRALRVQLAAVREAARSPGEIGSGPAGDRA